MAMAILLEQKRPLRRGLVLVTDRLLPTSIGAGIDFCHGRLKGERKRKGSLEREPGRVI
jgi:hypothetical protein